MPRPVREDRISIVFEARVLESSLESHATGFGFTAIAGSERQHRSRSRGGGGGGGGQQRGEQGGRDGAVLQPQRRPVREHRPHRSPSPALRSSAHRAIYALRSPETRPCVSILLPAPYAELWLPTFLDAPLRLLACPIYIYIYFSGRSFMNSRTPHCSCVPNGASGRTETPTSRCNTASTRTS